MNYFIEKHDMEIILDALEKLSSSMKEREIYGNYKYIGLTSSHFTYSKEDVDGLFQSFDNSFAES